MQKFSLKQTTVFFSILSLLLITTLATQQFANGNFLGEVITSATTTPEDPSLSDVEIIQELLKDEQMDPVRRKKLEERLRYFTEQEVFVQTATLKAKDRMAELEEGRKNPSAPKQGITLTGIIDEPLLVPGYDIVTKNAWQDLVDGEYFSVYAGYQKDEPSQGEICFGTESAPITCIYTPKKSGAVRVVEYKAKESKLILKSENGEHIFFDLRGRIFVRSLDEIVPTITPHAKAKSKETTVSTMTADYPAP